MTTTTTVSDPSYIAPVPINDPSLISGTVFTLVEAADAGWKDEVCIVTTDPTKFVGMKKNLGNVAEKATFNPAITKARISPLGFSFTVTVTA